MRGLTPAEEDALLIILANTTGDRTCGACWEANAEPDARFHLDEGLVSRLVERGLVHVEPCDDVLGDLHATCTSTGRLLLALICQARAA